jgi:hypothetical protein
MPFERSLSRKKWARLWHYSTKNLVSMKMASCHRESKNGRKMELFDKARTYGRFLNQRHVESARGFHVLRVIECLPTHSLLKPGSMASLNLQNFRKDFSQFYTFYTTTFKNLARLKIVRFQNVICDGLPCQVFSIEMWPISRASNVLLKACLRLPVGLAGYRWRPLILGLKLLTPAVRNC